MSVFTFWHSFLIPFASAGTQDIFYQLTVQDLAGSKTSLQKYAGKVVLVVNTASQCGYTPQYAALEKLYEENHAAGFEILAFPSNDFGGQEPASAPEIKKFCETRYHVHFALFSKAPVSGKNKQPLYRWLLKQRFPENENGKGAEVAWNFEKFLISKNGKVVDRFLSPVDPESETIKNAVKRELEK